MVKDNIRSHIKQEVQLQVCIHFVSLIAQSVYCLVTGWTTGRSRFNPWHRQKDFSSSLCVQTGSGAHPASCTMGTGVLPLGPTHGRGITLTTHPHLVPRSGMNRSYTSSPLKRLRGHPSNQAVADLCLRLRSHLDRLMKILNGGNSTMKFLT
jgi:hypothetical protein